MMGYPVAIGTARPPPVGRDGSWPWARHTDSLRLLAAARMGFPGSALSRFTRDPTFRVAGGGGRLHDLPLDFLYGPSSDMLPTRASKRNGPGA
jgi:predicted component of type VI protein secretion system